MDKVMAIREIKAALALTSARLSETAARSAAVLRQSNLNGTSRQNRPRRLGGIKMNHACILSLSTFRELFSQMSDSFPQISEN